MTHEREIPLDSWTKGASMEVVLQITTEFVNPDVELRIYREADLGTPIHSESMEQVDSGPEWKAVVSPEAFEVEIGETLWREIEFDDGTTNSRIFKGWLVVQHG